MGVQNGPDLVDGCSVALLCALHPGLEVGDGRLVDVDAFPRKKRGEVLELCALFRGCHVFIVSGRC